MERLWKRNSFVPTASVAMAPKKRVASDVASEASTVGSKRRKTGWREAAISSGRCIWCRCDIATTCNPINKDREKIPTLHRPTDFAPCTVCSATHRRYHPEKSHKTIGEDCATDVGHQNWLYLIHCYCCFKNGTPYEEYISPQTNICTSAFRVF